MWGDWGLCSAVMTVRSGMDGVDGPQFGESTDWEGVSVASSPDGETGHASI